MTIHTKLIEEKLEEFGWTQAVFAEKVGISLRTLSNILQSKEVKKIEHLTNMASVLGIDASELTDVTVPRSGRASIDIEKQELLVKHVATQDELIRAKEEIIRLKDQLLDKQLRENENLKLENERLKNPDGVSDKS